jgi:phosphoglycerate dehydrogenase-like enzyme
VSVVSVPTLFADLVGEVPGAAIVSWDLRDAPARQHEVEVVVVPPFGARWLTRLGELPSLRAVVLATAGFEHAVPHLPQGVALANAVGVHDTATAELALALMLAAQRDLPAFVRAQQSGTWLEPGVRRSLADSRVLIVGYGGIGRALARRLLACETTVTAVASRARAGDGMVDTVHPVESLHELLPHHDMVVLLTPLTERTRGLIDGPALARMPDDALLVNLARGPVVDTEALLAECGSGRLRAALDVTDPEPLPPGHPLWEATNVLISPHTGGSSTAFPPRAAAYVRRQIHTYLRTGTVDHVVAVGEGAHP